MRKHNLKCISGLLFREGKTVSVAESCTGGELASVLTSIPGSSKYFVLGLVVYHTKVKERVLNVSRETISRFSVYSPQTAYEMAKNVKNLSGSNIGISTTGEFNGNGYLYYCIYESENSFRVGKIEVFGDRNESKFQAVKGILKELLKFLLSS